MEPRYERYIAVLRQGRALAKPKITPGMKGPALLHLIQEDARTSYRLMQETNALLDELLFSRRAGDLTDADRAQLEEFAGALFCYANSEDCGIAYRVHKLLLEDARLRQDEPRILRELYYAGVTLHYLNIRADEYGINPFGAQVQAYFREGAGYLARYEEFDPQSRGTIIRCVGNSRMDMARDTPEACKAYLEVSDWAMQIIQSPRYRKLDPELPWDNFEYSMQMDCMTLLPYLQKREDPAVAARVLKAAEYIYRAKAPTEDERIQNWRIGYSYRAARYHAGVGTAREVVDELLYVAEHTRQDDYTPTGINNKLISVAFLFYYEQKMPTTERAGYIRRVEAAFESSFAYLNALPVNQYPRVASAAVRDLVEMQTEAARPYRKNLLLYILAAHKPTYVHSLMVANLTRYLVRQLVRTNPAALVGLLGCRTADEVKQRGDDLCLEAYECGLYHDIGKSTVTMYIGINSRRLMDEEFRCIQCHPDSGYELLCKAGYRDSLALGARYHHRYYDGTGGYPRDIPPCPAHYKPLVDVLAVADSLDAATDNIGRCYTVAKSVDELLAELRAQSGTRYAPQVVALFEDPAFCAELRQNLSAVRQSVYLEVYRENRT